MIKESRESSLRRDMYLLSIFGAGESEVSRTQDALFIAAPRLPGGKRSAAAAAAASPPPRTLAHVN